MSDTVHLLREALAGSYTLDRELGRGGMATVYLARDLKHERWVALKVLHAELGAVLGAERFLTEIRTTANLQHPNILPLFDSGSAAGLVYYVMPYVEGETLRARITREGQLGVAETIRLTRAIAGALDYAHRQGVIHRDIKPENILLQEGQPLVADFGVALAVSNAGGARVTQTGISVGTPFYMSPEQAAAERKLDGRSDQYSLASVAYEMLAGEPPFTGASAAMVMSRLMTETPRDVEQHRPSVPGHVNDAIMRALAKVPADRYERVVEFAEALATEPTAVYRARPVVADAGTRRRSYLVGALGAAALVAVTALATSAVTRRGGAGATADAGAPRHLVLALPDSLPLVSASDIYGRRLRSLDISPDGSSIVYNTARGSAGMLARLDLRDASARTIPGTEGASLPAISPDGNRLAFAVDSVLKVARLDGSEMVRVSAAPAATAANRIANSLAWGDAGVVLSSFSCLQAVGLSGDTLASVLGEVDGITCPLRSVNATRASARRSLMAARADARGFARYLLERIDREDGKALAIRGPAGAAASDTIFGVAPMLVDGRFVAFVRDSVLFAAPIDVAAARLLAPPKAILVGVRGEGKSNGAQIALGGDGTFVWAEGAGDASNRLVLLSRDGKSLDTLPLPPASITSVATSADGRRLAMSYRTESGYGLVVTGPRPDLVWRYTLPFQVAPTNWINSTDSGLIVTRYEGGTRLARLTPGGMTLDSFSKANSYSPDGRLACSLDGFIWATATPDVRTRYAKVESGLCAFSPNGRFVLTADASGVFAVPTSDPRAENVVRLSPIGGDVIWAGDTRVIIHIGRRILEVELDASGHPRAAPRLLYSGDAGDGQMSIGVGPDGRVLFIKEQPPLYTTRLHVITNFPRFLEEKLREAR